MTVKTITRKTFSSQIPKIIFYSNALAEKAVRLAEEKPLIAGGTALAFTALITSFKSQRVAPFFGVPAILLFAYQIFSDSPDRQEVVQKEQNYITHKQKQC